MTPLTSKQLRQAADIQDKIENLQNELKRLLSGERNSAANGSTSTKSASAPKNRTISAAGRAKIAAAARARWARVRAEKKK